jgi:ComF family protein
MSIIDDLIGVLVPHSCLACGAEGRLLCGPCSGQLTPVEPVCYRCQRPSLAGFTCLNCVTPLSQVRVVTGYGGSAKALIWQLKLNGAQAAAAIMARHMAPLLGNDKFIIVPVPTASSRARQRGYDQAKLLGRELSRQTGLRYKDCLLRHGQTHQHGASRRERLRQLEASFHTKRNVQNRRLLLIDDVMTTGATLEAAAKILKQAGAERIEAVVFARPDRHGNN